MIWFLGVSRFFLLIILLLQIFTLTVGRRRPHHLLLNRTTSSLRNLQLVHSTFLCSVRRTTNPEPGTGSTNSSRHSRHDVLGGQGPFTSMSSSSSSSKSPEVMEERKEDNKGREVIIQAAGLIIYRKINKNNSNNNSSCSSQNEYLLLQSAREKHNWTPPKGHLEWNDVDLLACAVRETLEETSIASSRLQLHPQFQECASYVVKKKIQHNKCVTYFLARYLGGVSSNTTSTLSDEEMDHPIHLSDEHLDFQWAPINEACDLAQYETMRDILKKAEEFLLKKEPCTTAKFADKI